MSDFFHLAIVDSVGGDFIAYARTDAGAAFGECKAKDLESLKSFRESIEKVLQGETKPFSEPDLTNFGSSLFDYSLNGEVRNLYNGLPADSYSSIEICSRKPSLLEIPWEYIQFPQSAFGPSAARSVVRVVPTVGFGKVIPKKVSKLNVLFAVAAPIDQGLISWVEVQQSLENAFLARLSEGVKIDVIQVTTRQKLAEAITSKKYDVFHFLGHGENSNGVTNLLLVDDQNRTTQVSTREFCQLLGGQSLSLVVLSACNSGSGNFESPHAVLAKSLVECGIPAVIASQVSLPDATVAGFTGALYKNLLATGDIDRAVSIARVTLAFELGSSSAPSLEWGIPVLYRRNNSGHLLEV